MTDPTNLVFEFHQTYGHPVSAIAAPPSAERTDLRINLITEEFLELLEAVYGPSPRTSHIREEVTKLQKTPAPAPAPRTATRPTPDLVETADALADLIYVIYGMALEYGIPLSAVLQEVHRSNMSKLDPETGQPIYREDGKILKGSGFTEPDIKKTIEENSPRLPSSPTLSQALSKAESIIQKDPLGTTQYARGAKEMYSIFSSALGPYHGTRQ